MAKKLSKEEWERRVNEVGAGRYEFVRWEVGGEFGAHKKCVVRCIKDGYAWASKANNLVDGGNGCPNCARQRKWTPDERIEQINKLENIEFASWFDSYIGVNSKANVRCMIDGFIWAASVDNLVNHGKGCPRCAGNIRCTAEERIEKINELKNIEFISWKDGYKNNNSKANVRCKVDGFAWSASVGNLVNHGTSCPCCAKYGYDTSKDGYLYALRSECGKYIKVGISNKPLRRRTELARSTPFKFNIVEQFEGGGDKIAELEKYFHGKYERAGFVGFDGATEWLVCSDDLLSELRRVSIEHE